MSQSLFKKATRIYQDGGFSELTKRASKKFLTGPIFYDPLINNLSKSSFSNEDLLKYSQRKGEIYKWESDLINLDASSPLSNAIDCSQRRMCVIYNGKIIGNRGLILTEGNQPILQSIKHLDYYLTPSIKSAPISTKIDLAVSNFYNNGVQMLESGKSDESAINLVMHIPGEHHYGHWLVEYLPKLYHLEQYETQTNIKPNIIVNDGPPQWMIDSIVALGYSEKQIIEFDYTRREIQNLLIPLSSLSENKINDISFSPIELQWLRKQYRKKLIDSTSGPDRIYVSRQGLRQRKVTNYTKLENLLVDNGFEIIRPEELEFTEQVEAFSNADIIIGGYGSGLHNMLFAENANIIEFFPPTYTSYLNSALACSLGHKYSSIDGTKASDFDKQSFGKNLNYQVPISEVEKIIKNI